jgi:hypothetical protein
LPSGQGDLRSLALGEQARESEMIDFYYWPMPNGHKITTFLAVGSAMTM